MGQNFFTTLLLRNIFDMYINFIKPTLDRVFAVILFTVLLPLFLLIALIIIIDIKKNPFFTQRRNGKDNKIFVMIKFCTLKDNHTTFEQVKTDSDDISFSGRILRTTHLDEIPQLLNIINGTMSFIGPRPHFPDHDNELITINPNYMSRYRVKPGFTGLAQINNNRGRIENNFQAEERLKYDLIYIENCSFFLDLRITIKSIWIFFSSLFKS